MRALISSLLALSVACSSGGECTPGAQRDCNTVLDGGSTQRGYQACGAAGTWSACIPVGACTAGGSLPVYARCATSEQCGPSSCATCGHYAGVENPEAHQLCYAYCVADADCAPTTAAAGVTPRCVLGQCALYCAAGASCPNDTRCLPWNSAQLATANPGFAGLCE